MQVLILIEPTETGCFRARAGEPFNASAEGESADKARQQLEILLRQRLQNGNQLATIELGGSAQTSAPAPLKLAPVPDDDWFFRTLREVIAENRQQEDEATP
jgi:hypothetical protein